MLASWAKKSMNYLTIRTMGQEVEKQIQAIRGELLSELFRLRDELKFVSKRLYSVEDAAHYLSLSPKTIRNGLGPRATKPFPVKPVRHGGRVLFRREDLDRYIDSL